MVEVSGHENTKTIVAKPNHSATWRTNLWVLIAISIPSMGAAISFALLGAWPILPFAGAELLALSSALYYVNWKLQYRHVIYLTADTVKIDKGHYAPKRTWLFTREQVALSITPEAHPWEGPKLALHDKESHIRIGEFLNREDSLVLLELLQQEFRIKTHSAERERQL